MGVEGIPSGAYSGSLANLTAQARYAAQVKPPANPVPEGKDASSVVNKGSAIVRHATDGIDERTEAITKTPNSVIRGDPNLGTNLDILACVVFGYISMPFLYQLLQK